RRHEARHRSGSPSAQPAADLVAPATGESDGAAPKRAGSSIRRLYLCRANNVRQPGDSLADLFRRDGAVGEPQIPPATAIGEERGAGDVVHARGTRGWQELNRVNALRKRDPDEETAVRVGPLHPLRHLP